MQFIVQVKILAIQFNDFKQKVKYAMKIKRLKIYTLLTFLVLVVLAFTSIINYVRSLNNQAMELNPYDQFEVNIDNQDLSGVIYDYGRQEDGFYFIVITRKSDNVVDGYFFATITDDLNFILWEGPYSEIISKDHHTIQVNKNMTSHPKGYTNVLKGESAENNFFEYTIKDEFLKDASKNDDRPLLCNTKLEIIQTKNRKH